MKVVTIPETCLLWLEGGQEFDTKHQFISEFFKKEFKISYCRFEC